MSISEFPFSAKLDDKRLGKLLHVSFSKQVMHNDAICRSTLYIVGATTKMEMKIRVSNAGSN